MKAIAKCLYPEAHLATVKFIHNGEEQNLIKDYYEDDDLNLYILIGNKIVSLEVTKETASVR